VVDKAVVDKQVVVGAGVQLGWGDDGRPNYEMPDRLDSGVTVVGKGAHIAASIRVGRNVLIQSDVDEDVFQRAPNGLVPSGATVKPGELVLPPETPLAPTASPDSTPATPEETAA
jgi:glucose-1-phosphate adenylyltransferase